MSRALLPVVVALVLIAAFWRLPALDQGVEPVDPSARPVIVAPGAAPLPAGHPPVGGARPEAGEPSPDAAPGDLPLAETGLGGRTELERALERIPDEASRRAFDEAFRLTFTSARGARDYERAKGALHRVLEKNPALAEGYRTLAYAEFNTTLSFPRTIELYERAVTLDPAYGEAHYALSFMLGGTDRERGAVHFERAMALGVTDERGLRERFYPNVPIRE